MTQTGTYDTMQVCRSGHRINHRFRDRPEFNKARCPDCGDPTISVCPECKEPIKGAYKPPGLSTLPPAPLPVPSFCDSCGMAYPWQLAGVAELAAGFRKRPASRQDRARHGEPRE
jgi:hypothetical protein